MAQEPLINTLFYIPRVTDTTEINTLPNHVLRDENKNIHATPIPKNKIPPYIFEPGD
jgi:hypothetical protein